MVCSVCRYDVHMLYVWGVITVVCVGVITVVCVGVITVSHCTRPTFPPYWTPPPPSHTLHFSTWQAAVFCVWSCNALGKMHKTSQTLSLNAVGTVPYEQRYIRTLIDSCAFHIYGHWVKRGEEQNRAALFETTPKMMHVADNDSLKKFKVACNTASNSRTLLA